MKQALITSVMLLTLLGAGCGASGTAPVATNTEVRTGTPVAAGAKTCAAYGASDTAIYTVGRDVMLPTDFPRPPSGAELCGSSTRLEWVYFILPNGDAKTILAAYESALVSGGYKIVSTSTDAVRFDNGQKFGSGKYTSGSVTYNQKTGELGVGYHSDEWRAAHPNR